MMIISGSTHTELGNLARKAAQAIIISRYQNNFAVNKNANFLSLITHFDSFTRLCLCAVKSPLADQPCVSQYKVLATIVTRSVSLLYADVVAAIFGNRWFVV